jgi:hypothetical protein
LKKEPIPLTDIFLDVHNPRLKSELNHENTAIVDFFLDPNNKVLALAKDIAEFGIDPSQRAIVMRADDGDDETYIVLEGNRRICALKILSAPEILNGSIPENKQRTINKLAEQFRKHSIDVLDCAVVDNRTEADRWLQLRHTGQNSGVGVVEWDAELKARYLTRLTQGKHIGVQVLDIVDAHGLLSEKAKKSDKKVFDAIRRMVTDADAQRVLGYQIINNKLHSYFPADEVAKALTKIVEDFKTGAKNTNDIHSKKNRTDYLKEFKKANKPDPAKKKSELRELDSGNVVTDAQKKATKPRRQPAQKDRPYIVPSEFRLSIPHHRLSLIYGELRKLRFEGNVNAIGVMFRAFLEMSIDEFVSNKNITVKVRRGTWPSLMDKVLAVADYLENLSTGAWSSGKLRPVRKFASISHVQGTNVDTLHAWVHDRNFSPAPIELRTAWNNLEPFIKRLWE